MKIGYARVSTEDQSLDRQLDAFKVEGVERIYKENITGTKMERPQFQAMMENLREGDIIIIESLSRLSRSLKHLLEIVEQLEEKKVHLKSLKEPWLDTTSPQGKFLLAIFAGLSQFERDLISQRTKEGLKSARARGHEGGRPKANQEKLELGVKMYLTKFHTWDEITKATGVSKQTIYRELKKKGLIDNGEN